MAHIEKKADFLNRIQENLKSKDLKITPQRMCVLEAVYTLNNHPTAEQVIDFVHTNHPNIATGTVYKTLDTFVKKGVITKFRTKDEAARYDGILAPHHHLCSSEDDHIEDYVDEELDRILNDYFEKKQIDYFEIESVKLHINGRFSSK